MCPLWVTGFCPKGAECEHSHPRFEGIIDRLRIKPDNDPEKEETPEVALRADREKSPENDLDDYNPDE